MAEIKPCPNCGAKNGRCDRHKCRWRIERRCRGMTAKDRIRLERLTGQIEGLSFCIENNGISGVLLDIAEAIDGVIKDESEVDTK